jgi:hypothetical protein
VFAHALAAGSVSLLMIPAVVRLALIGIVASSLIIFFQRQQRQIVAMLHLGTRGELEIETKVGAGETATIATIEPYTTILPGLIVLLLRCQGKRLVLPLLADSVSTDNYRQLRLWLQWRAKTRVSASV